VAGATLLAEQRSEPASTSPSDLRGLSTDSWGFRVAANRSRFTPFPRLNIQPTSDHFTSFSRPVALSNRTIARHRSGPMETIPAANTSGMSPVANRKTLRARLDCTAHLSIPIFPRVVARGLGAAIEMRSLRVQFFITLSRPCDFVALEAVPWHYGQRLFRPGVSKDIL